MSGKKFDSEKLKVELLYSTLVNELEDVAKVLTFGANKYGRNNWQELDEGFERYSAALFRHINARLKGQHNDPESGLTHLSHAACCLLFMMHLDKKDDGWIEGLLKKIDLARPKSIFDNNGIHYGDSTSIFFDEE